MDQETMNDFIRDSGLTYLELRAEVGDGALMAAHGVFARRFRNASGQNTLKMRERIAFNSRHNNVVSLAFVNAARNRAKIR